MKQEIQNYNVINLKDISQNESDIPDNIRNSIFLYNKALESMKNGSEDIAIIELKKAINMNPHFYEAMNLLGICYSYIKDNVKAAEIFEKVVKAEQNSVKALKYLSMLNSTEDVNNKLKKRTVSISEKDTLSKSRITNQKQKKSFTQDTLKYLAFFVAGILVFFIFQSLISKPATKTDGKDLSNTTATQNTANEFKAKYEELLPEYELLQKDKDTANAAVDYYKSVVKLYEIESLATKKQYTSAADMLLLMKSVAFKDDDKVKYEQLYASIMPTAAWIVYNDGYKLYNKKNYADDIKKFEKVEIYDPNFSRLDAVLYYMGKSYQQLKDSRNAIALYQRLIENYPKSSYALNAKSKIKALTQQP